MVAAHSSVEHPVDGALCPRRAELDAIFWLKNREPLGPGPARRRRFDYFTPDEWYEALVAKLVFAGCRWLDVGCGRFLFPSNAALAQQLADRAGHLTGVDPSDNIHDNPFVDERFQGLLEEYQISESFDLVTFRMVVEHVTDPEATVAKLAKLVRPGGRVVVYTVNRWSPVTLVSAVTPFALHGPLVKFFFNTEERDAFPTAYRMNTRQTLARQFADGGFREEWFRRLSDCRVLKRFSLLNAAEMWLGRTLERVGLRYPENCLLGVYRREN